MWVKICGITNEEDALMAVAMGADAVGFVFAPSPRQVTVGTVRDITRRLPFGVMTVGVFRDQAPDQVIDTILAAGLHAAQLHGHETPNEARQIRQKAQALIVAFPAGSTSVARFDGHLRMWCARFLRRFAKIPACFRARSSTPPKTGFSAARSGLGPRNWKYVHSTSPL